MTGLVELQLYFFAIPLASCQRSLHPNILGVRPQLRLPIRVCCCGVVQALECACSGAAAEGAKFSREIN